MASCHTMSKDSKPLPLRRVICRPGLLSIHDPPIQPGRHHRTHNDNVATRPRSSPGVNDNALPPILQRISTEKSQGIHLFPAGQIGHSWRRYQQPVRPAEAGRCEYPWATDAGLAGYRRCRSRGQDRSIRAPESKWTWARLMPLLVRKHAVWCSHAQGPPPLTVSRTGIPKPTVGFEPTTPGLQNRRPKAVSLL